MTYSRDERLALADLLERTGPDAPTLCEGWQTRDLAAHLVVRESRPDAAAGVAGGPLAGYTARVQRQMADKLGYDGLVRAFRGGPPRLSLFALPGLDEAANTVEYFVHHEDVRRAVPDWAPRDIPEGLADALWSRLKAARLFLRRAPVGIQLARDGARGDVGSPVLVKKGASVVTVTGTPAELTMWVMGRAGAANVAFDGPPDAVARLQDWRTA